MQAVLRRIYLQRHSCLSKFVTSRSFFSYLSYLVSKDRTLTFILAKQNNATWNPGRGLGDLPSITYSYEEKRVFIQLQCATDETNELEALGESPINFFKFRLTNKCACWDGCKSKYIFYPLT